MKLCTAVSDQQEVLSPLDISHFDGRPVTNIQYYTQGLNMFMNIKASCVPIMTNKKWHTVNSRKIIQLCYIIVYFLYLMVCWDYSHCNLHVLVLLQILHKNV